MLRNLLVAVLLCALVSPAGAEGVFVFQEAEEFQPAAGDWQAADWGTNYYCATFADTFLSRQRYLGAPEQGAESEASATVEIPAAGRYMVLARYEACYGFNTCFAIRIEQGGKTVFDHSYGSLANVKLWPFGHGLTPQARFSWGPCENIVWEGVDNWADLQAGPARLVLVKGPQPEPAARRNVDLLMLTTNRADVEERIAHERYLPLDGLLTQSGDLYLKVTNTSSAKATLGIGNTEHSPYWVHRRAWPAMPKIELDPGQSTDWLEIGSSLDSLNENTLRLGPKFEGEAGAFVLEFGVPEAGAVKPIKRVEVTEAMRVAVPGGVRYGAPILTEAEVHAHILAAIAAHEPHGRRPQRFPFFGVRTHLIGYDALPQREIASLGDEIGLPGLGDLEAQQEPFRDYLRAQGLKPSHLGAADWDGVTLNLDDPEANPRTYFHSRLFQVEHGISALKEGTEAKERETPGVLVGANYSPHAFYRPTEGQWVRVFKRRAMTMPWSEDYNWQIPEASVGITAYLVDVFRCGAKYHDLPIMFYVMPHAPGNTPRSFKLSFISAVGHGATLINFFMGEPIVSGYTENYVRHESTDHYCAMRDVVDLAGAAEDFLLDGQVRPAQVALLISHTGDIWDPMIPYNHERKSVYVALRHAGYPVDVVTEEDVIEGGLAGYRVLYVFGNHLERRTVRALTRWVTAGGTVVATAGGGFLDEYDHPNPTAAALYGAGSDAVEQRAEIIQSKVDLPTMPPLDRIRFRLPGESRDRSIEALAFRQTLSPGDDAQVLGRFAASGAPAVTFRPLGEGGALLVASFPGAAYLKKALPHRPPDRGNTDDAYSHFLPTDFDEDAAALITYPVRAAGVEQPVQSSEPLVLATVIESEHGWAVPLGNFSGKPQARVALRILGAAGFSDVQSAGEAELQVSRQGNDLLVTLPLETIDILLLHK